MQFEEIKNKLEIELQNKKTYDKLLDKIENQLKVAKKAETIYNKEREKLENLIIEKEKITASIQNQERDEEQSNE